MEEEVCTMSSSKGSHLSVESQETAWGWSEANVGSRKERENPWGNEETCLSFTLNFQVH